MIERTLDNGVKLVGQPLPNMRSVTVGIWTAAGSVTETPEENGISHFIEHMLFKGTENRSARQISMDVDSIGGQINAFTSKEATCYYIRVIDEKLGDGIDILTDLFCNSSIPAEELEKERGVVLEEIAMSRDMLDDLVMDMLAGVYFGDTAMGRTILGPEENIKRFSRDDLLAYLQKMYTAKNMVVSVAGNFDEDRLMHLLNENMSTVRTGAPQIPKSADMTGYRAKPGFAYFEKDAEQMHVSLGFPGVAVDSDRARYALDVLSNIIGGSMSSRLFQRIREEMGMAYSVYSHSSVYRNTGMFDIYAGTTPRNIEDVTKLILEELDKVRAHGVTEEEIAQSKQMLKGHIMLQLESTGGRMSSIGRSWLLRGKLRSDDEVLQMIDDVTMADVNAQIEIVTDPAQMSAAFVGPGGDGESLREIIEDAQKSRKIA